MITRPNWHPPTGTCERSEHADEDGRNGWPNPDPADLGQHPHRLHQHGRVAHRASSRPRRADHGEVRAAVRPARVQPRRRRRPATSPSTSPQPPRADHRPPSSAIEVSAAGMRRHNPPPRVSPGPAAFGGGADAAPRHPRLDPAGRRKAPPGRATGRRRTRRHRSHSHHPGMVNRTRYAEVGAGLLAFHGQERPDRTSLYPSGSAIVTPQRSQYGLRAATRVPPVSTRRRTTSSSTAPLR